jgi:hypothetical protein
MKKLFLTAVAAMFALAAGAQNQAIDELIEKYTDREGFTVMNMEGEAIKGLSSMVAQGDGTINLGDGTRTYKIGELLEEIVSVTAIVLEQADEVFVREARNAISSKDYSPIVSHNENGESVKILSAEIKRGQYRGNKEIVVMVVDNDETVLVRVIGKIDAQLLAKLANGMSRS